jgi:hypothetical protein
MARKRGAVSAVCVPAALGGPDRREPIEQRRPEIDKAISTGYHLSRFQWAISFIWLYVPKYKFPKDFRV